MDREARTVSSGADPSPRMEGVEEEVMTVLATIVVLGVLIFVHELGPFWAAKLVGVEVQRFSIGLGPRIWGVNWGETEYVFSAIPLGGYVKMGGMEDEVLDKLEGGGSQRTQGPRSQGLRREAHLGQDAGDFRRRHHEHGLRLRHLCRRWRGCGESGSTPPPESGRSTRPTLPAGCRGYGRDPRGCGAGSDRGKGRGGLG